MIFLTVALGYDFFARTMMGSIAADSAVETMQFPCSGLMAVWRNASRREVGVGMTKECHTS